MCINQCVWLNASNGPWPIHMAANVCVYVNVLSMCVETNGWPMCQWHYLLILMCVWLCEVAIILSLCEMCVCVASVWLNDGY